MEDTPDGNTPGTVPLRPGIMSVMSTVLHPEALNPLHFCNWYEDTHIQEVQATGGISRTQRYESLNFDNKYRKQDGALGSQPIENLNCKYDFITVYRMPDLAFRESAAFKGLAGQSRPSDESNLLENIFEHAEFCTRFCEELETDAFDPSPAPFLLTIGIDSAGVPLSHSISSIVKALSQLPSRKKTTAYKVHEGSILSEFKRTYHKEPSGMILVGLDSKSDTYRIVEELQAWEGLEIGFWKLRRDYEGSERTPAPWKPR